MSSSSVSSPNLYSGSIGGLESSSAAVPSIPVTFPLGTHQQPPSFLPSPNVQASSQARQSTSSYNTGIPAWQGTPDSATSIPQTIPSRILEPATPQNTPANATFAGFASSYAASRPGTLISAGRADSQVTSGFSSSPGITKFSEGVTFDVPSSAFARTNSGPISGTIIEPNISSSTEGTTSASGASEDKSFTHISAARVTAKLEHILAERGEDSLTTRSENAKLTESDQQVPKSEHSEDLSEVDLTTNEFIPDVARTQETLAASQISVGFASPLETESFARSGSHLSTPAEANVSSKSSSIADSFSVNQTIEPSSSVIHFFSGGNQGRKSELNYFPSSTEGSGSSVFYSSPPQVQTQQAPSSFFESGPPVAVPNARTQFLTPVSNIHQTTTSAQPIPKFYNPGGFPTPLQDPTYSVFNPQISVGAPTTQNPFTAPLDSSSPDFAASGFMATAMPEPTGSATLNPVQMSANTVLGRSSSETVPPSLQSLVRSHNF